MSGEMDKPAIIYKTLNLAGWSIGEVASGTLVIVTGSNGEKLIHAAAEDRADAWRIALSQAEAAGLT
jgi:hypothetical protein